MRFLREKRGGLLVKKGRLGSFIVLIVVLLVKPTGIMGHKVTEKV